MERSQRTCSSHIQSTQWLEGLGSLKSTKLKLKRTISTIACLPRSNRLIDCIQYKTISLQIGEGGVLNIVVFIKVASEVCPVIVMFTKYELYQNQQQENVHNMCQRDGGCYSTILPAIVLPGTCKFVLSIFLIIKIIIK